MWNVSWQDSVSFWTQLYRLLIFFLVPAWPECLCKLYFHSCASMLELAPSVLIRGCLSGNQPSKDLCIPNGSCALGGMDICAFALFVWQVIPGHCGKVCCCFLQEQNPSPIPTNLFHFWASYMLYFVSCVQPLFSLIKTIYLQLACYLPPKRCFLATFPL